MSDGDRIVTRFPGKTVQVEQRGTGEDMVVVTTVREADADQPVSTEYAPAD